MDNTQVALRTHDGWTLIQTLKELGWKGGDLIPKQIDYLKDGKVMNFLCVRRVPIGDMIVFEYEEVVIPLTGKEVPN